MKRMILCAIVLMTLTLFGGADCNTTCFGNCCTETCCASGYDGYGNYVHKCTTCQTCCTNFGGMQNCNTNCY